jgi:ribosome-associated heat shock protein Hsp15
MSANADAAGLRLDKWLWYARFFKTRALATKAISGGRFRLDGAVMSKPHRQAKPGQVLTFTQGNRIRVVRIAALGTRRGPAADAVLLYDDLAPIVPETDKPRDKPASIFEDRGAGGGRPTKRQRRETDKLKAGFLEAED